MVLRSEDVIAGHYPLLRQIVGRVLQRWPEHSGFLRSRFAEEEPAALDWSETVARTVWPLVAQDLDGAVDAYRWLGETFFAEDLHFQRYGRYRNSSFAEVEAEIYADSGYMTRYMKGLLMTQLLWTNHARVLHTYAHAFLACRGHREHLLEVGPGHGLFLALAAAAGVRDLTGWDISEGSLEFTRASLERLGRNRVSLARRDVTDRCADGTYDLVVASEILEHLEDPALVLAALRDRLAPDGLIFLNVPVNSPAPDHIYLWRSPEEFFGFVADCGIRPVRTWAFPMTGYTEERARRRNRTLSCVVVGSAAPREQGG
ncbi:class I SAM-dependent methyltransferase [Streptomyces sp. NPDC019443]|uniref:class I SAM-dependent methyltransferase n=1 Tax=Streptomyces sp. NPDC019443 TaxID=3365061 RepID=UPI0037B5082D